MKTVQGKKNSADIKTTAFAAAVFLYFPFSPAGTILFAAAVYILGKSYAQKNAYGLFLSIAALLILILLIILGRLQARRFASSSSVWDSGGALYAGRKGTFQSLTIPDTKCFTFFRVHFRITGKLKVDTDAALPFYAEAGFSGNGTLKLPFSLPVSGLARARGVLLVRDIFGLTRSRFSDVMRRELPVNPKLLPEGSSLSLDTMGGFDSKNRRKNADEEKYYMREYIPGDRIRDINWKASSRVNKFITRISPVTQEQTKVLYVDIRTYREPGPISLDEVLHLDFMKTRLVTFLWNVKKDHEDYSFIIRTGRDEFKIDTIDDIVKLAQVLSTIWFHHDRSLFPELPASARLFIFSTAFDTGLSLAVTHYAGFSLDIMTTSGPDNGDAETVKAALFAVPGLYLPQPWMLRRRPPRQGAPAVHGAGKMDSRPLDCSLFPVRDVKGGTSH